MEFKLQHTAPESKARAGLITTDHGVIETPIFMPVGTAAAMKGIFHRDIENEAKAQIILANTYHLYLRPGMGILEQAGERAIRLRRSWERCKRVAALSASLSASTAGVRSSTMAGPRLY